MTSNTDRSRKSHRVDRNTSAQAVLQSLRRYGPSSQAEIARVTSLARATVNNIVQSLRDQGVVEYEWKNRREALVTLTSLQGAVIAAKVAERSSSVSLFDFATEKRYDLSGESLPKYQKSVSSPAMVLALIKQCLDVARSLSTPVAGVAIAIEGPIEKKTNAIARWAWQRLPEWKGINLAQYFGNSLQIPLVVDNDANLAALAEWTWGQGRGCDDFLHIICSAGIGGGIILNGKIYHGGIGLAGEIGHMVIEESGSLCFCGSRGCLTSFATERAILTALEGSANVRHSLMEVVDGAKLGDAACQRVLFEAGVHLGKALATVVRVISPSVITIGGTLATAGDILLEGVRTSAEVTNLRAIGEAPKFCLATVVDHAPELGGVSTILERLGFGVGNLSAWMTEAQPLLVPKQGRKKLASSRNG